MDELIVTLDRTTTQLKTQQAINVVLMKKKEEVTQPCLSQSKLNYVIRIELYNLLNNVSFHHDLLPDGMALFRG